MLAGQLTVGETVSVTETVNEQLELKLNEFVAVHVTVVTPNANAEPEAGTHEVVYVVVSTTVAAPYVTRAEGTPPAVGALAGAGHVIVGAEFCDTTTGNVHIDCKFA